MAVVGGWGVSRGREEHRRDWSSCVVSAKQFANDRRLIVEPGQGGRCPERGVEVSAEVGHRSYSPLSLDSPGAVVGCTVGGWGKLRDYVTLPSGDNCG